MALSYEIHDLQLDDAQQQLRDGIFNMNTRRFGKVAEFMIAKQYGYSTNTGTTDYDLISNDNSKIEVKFSRAEFKEGPITLNNCLQVCMENARPQLRRISCTDVTDGDIERVFNSNIQQIKAFEFDYLYYGLFFDDQIAIFKMSSQDVKNIMTAQYFVSKSKRPVDRISPRADIERITQMLENGGENMDVQVSQSLRNVQNIFQFIVNTRNPYARTAQEYIALNDMKTPWDNIIIEISENNGNFQTEYIERITEICRQYYAFCDETFPEDERFPDTSPFQHKGNEKAEGQMHFTDKNFTWHIEESGHFCGWLSYKDLYELFSEDTE